MEDSTTCRNLARILVDLDIGGQIPQICLLFSFGVIGLLASLYYNQSVSLPVKNYTQGENFLLYVYNIKQRYILHLPNATTYTFIPISLSNWDEPTAPIGNADSANEQNVSKLSTSFDDLSKIDASPGSRILLVGQPGITTTLLQRITRYWSSNKALFSCLILLYIDLRDLVLLQHDPNLTTFLSFMGNTWLPPDIETHILKHDGRGLCFIADGLDKYPAGYEDKNNFIFSLIRAPKFCCKLAQSTVVISCRPEVASRVWDLFEKRVDVLGFGDDRIR